MKRASIEEVDYYEFVKALGEARDNGKRIEPTEKDRWRTYMRENDIKEVAFMTMVRERYEDAKPVVIDDEGKWAGFYGYSNETETCLKWVREG